MRRLFRLTPEAKRDLAEILLNISEDSPETAEWIRKGFLAGLNTLGQSPGIGHYHEELLDRKYRFWNFYSYVIVYAWEVKPIHVICIVHGSRDLAAFLNTRTGKQP